MSGWLGALAWLVGGCVGFAAGHAWARRQPTCPDCDAVESIARQTTLPDGTSYRLTTVPRTRPIRH